MNVCLPLLPRLRVFLCNILKENLFYACRATLEEVEGDVTELELKLDKVSF